MYPGEYDVCDVTLSNAGDYCYHETVYGRKLRVG